MIKHPLHSIPFKTLYDELQLRCLEGTVREIRQDNLSLFHYTQDCVINKRWDDYTRSARGLVIDRSKEKIVAYPLVKFFNAFENGYDIPDEEFETFEKYDGSMIILFYCNNKWNVITKGSFNSEQGQWATAFFQENFNPDRLNKNYTYIAEIIYQENKIVVPYDYEDLVLLAVVDNITGIELDSINLRSLWPWPHRVAASYQYNSIDALIGVAKKMSYKEEGFVVKFSSGTRLKIKSDDYVQVHRLISQITPLGVWRILIDKMDWTEHPFFLDQLPEEIKGDYLAMRKLLGDRCENIYQYAHRAYLKSYKKVNHIEDMREKKKQFALLVKDLDHSDIIFYIYENTQEQGVKAKILRKLRPTDNVLEGYTPSDIVTRFQNVEL